MRGGLTAVAATSPKCYMLHMKKAGVRELRQRASDLLRRVAAGETIQITEHGRPIALLAPLPGGGPLQRLVAEGEVDQATAELHDLPDPLPLPRGAPRPSAVLAELRERER